MGHVFIALGSSSLHLICGIAGQPETAMQNWTKT